MTSSVVLLHGYTDEASSTTTTKALIQEPVEGTPILIMSATPLPDDQRHAVKCRLPDTVASLKD